MTITYTRYCGDGTYQTVVDYKGITLGTFEKYNSSMDLNSYHAIYWDETTQSVRDLCYGADGDKNIVAPIIDATPEVVTKAERFHAETLFKTYLRHAQVTARQIVKFSNVVVARGRKLPKGTKGKVMWLGENAWGQIQLGLKVEGQDRLQYTAYSNCELVEEPAVDEGVLMERAVRDAKKYHLAVA